MRSLNKYIEECGEVSTPSNTMGMGDVMLPDGENLGVDGIPQKKNKKKKKISESVFDEEEKHEGLDNYVDEYQLALYLLNSLTLWDGKKIKNTEELAKKIVANRIICLKSKKIFSIDHDKYLDILLDNNIKSWDKYVFTKTANNLVEKIIFINTFKSNTDVRIICIDEDLPIDVEVYRYDVGSKSDDVEITTRNNTLTLKSIKCYDLDISSYNINLLKFNNINARNVDLSQCGDLKKITGKFDIECIKISDNIIKEYLSELGIKSDIRLVINGIG